MERHFTFVPNAIEQAFHDRGSVPHGGIFHHSNCGPRYALITYVEWLATAGIEPSVGTVGNTLPAEAERQYYSIADNMDMAA
jgi:transposase InsO family protein